MLSVTVILLFLQSATCSAGVFYTYRHPAFNRAHQGHRRFGNPRNRQHTHTVTHQYAKNFYYFGAPDNRPELANGNELQGLQKDLQVIFVEPNAQNVYRNNFYPTPPFHNAVQPQPHVHVLNSLTNIVGSAHRFQASGCQQLPAEVKIIKFRTVPEYPAALQATATRYEMTSGGLVRGPTHGARTETADSMAPGLNVRYMQRPFSPAVGQPSYEFAGLPVDKNYAINYLPMDIDVVPGSSYLPLRRRRWIADAHKSATTNRSLL